MEGASRAHSPIAAVRALVHRHELQILVPKLVIDEFARNREQIEIDMTRRLEPTFQAVRNVLGQHGDRDERDQALNQLTDLEYRNRYQVTPRIELGQSSKCLCLPGHDRSLHKDRGLQSHERAEMWMHPLTCNGVQSEAPHCGNPLSIRRLSRGAAI